MRGRHDLFDFHMIFIIVVMEHIVERICLRKVFCDRIITCACKLKLFSEIFPLQLLSKININKSRNKPQGKLTGVHFR